MSKKVRQLNSIALTPEGMEIFGTVFPEGYIPIKHRVPVFINLGGREGQYYLADYYNFASHEQRMSVRKILMEKSKITRDEFEKQLHMMKDSIPIRVELCDSETVKMRDYV